MATKPEGGVSVPGMITVVKRMPARLPTGARRQGSQLPLQF